jgi:hypothetical protein
MLLSPSVILVAAVAGTTICRATGVDPHLHELLLACGLALLASAAGVSPILCLPHAAPASRFQAALLGSILHLLICLVGGCSVVFLRHPTDAFVYWMLILYWLTLSTMCVVFVSRLRTPVRSLETPSH